MNWICEHPLGDLYVLGKHNSKCLQCFSFFFSKFLNVSAEKVSASFGCLWGVLSLLELLWFSMQSYTKVFLKHFESFPVNYFWPSGILWSIIFCNWNIFSMILALLIFQNHRESLLKQMEKVINSWRGEAGNKMDKLQMIFCVGPPSINFISFGLRLFLHRKLEAFLSLFPFFPSFRRGGDGGCEGTSFWN